MDKTKFNFTNVFAFACLFLAFGFMFYTVKFEDTPALAAMRMFALNTVAASAVYWVLGSSRSSQKKDDTIQDMATGKNTDDSKTETITV